MLSLLRGEVLTEFINSLVPKLSANKKCKRRREFKSLVIFAKIITKGVGFTRVHKFSSFA